jgi:hypothetical protein
MHVDALTSAQSSSLDRIRRCEFGFFPSHGCREVIGEKSSNSLAMMSWLNTVAVKAMTTTPYLGYDDDGLHRPELHNDTDGLIQTHTR